MFGEEIKICTRAIFTQEQFYEAFVKARLGCDNALIIAEGTVESFGRMFPRGYTIYSAAGRASAIFTRAG